MCQRCGSDGPMRQIGGRAGAIAGGSPRLMSGWQCGTRCGLAESSKRAAGLSEPRLSFATGRRWTQASRSVSRASGHWLPAEEVSAATAWKERLLGADITSQIATTRECGWCHAILLCAPWYPPGSHKAMGEWASNGRPWSRRRCSGTGNVAIEAEMSEEHDDDDVHGRAEAEATAQRRSAVAASLILLRRMYVAVRLHSWA